MCGRGDELRGGEYLNGWTDFLAGSEHTYSVRNYRSSWAPSTSYPVGCTDQSSTVPAITALVNVYLYSQDPADANTHLYYGKPMCLIGGKKYTFDFNWNAYALNTVTAYGQAAISTTINSSALATSVLVTIEGCTTQSSGTGASSGCQSQNKTGSGSVSFTPATSGTYFFRYVWWFGTAKSYTGSTCADRANDIAFQEPTVTCT